MNAPPHRPTRRVQRGTTLLEGLVAFGLLCLGMLTVARVQSQLHVGAELAEQRLQAVRLARQEFESLRDVATLAGQSASSSDAEIVSGARRVAGDLATPGAGAYRVTRTVSATDTAAAQDAAVTVSWSDRAGGTQQLRLNSIIAGADPAYSGALALQGSAAGMRRVLGRAGTIPADAQDLGNGTSVFRPLPGAALALVMDNATAQVLARCATAPVGRDLTAADLRQCDDHAGYLISGLVRFALDATVDPARANDVPPDARVTLWPGAGSDPVAPQCTTQALMTVASTSAAGGVRLDAVPLETAAPKDGGVPTGERYLAYHCVVTPRGPQGWSGTTLLQPQGGRVGTGPGAPRVCRFLGTTPAGSAAPAVPSGSAAPAVPAGAMPAPDHVGVQHTLAHQNFLAIPSSATCPPGTEPTPVPAAAGMLRTAVHTP